MSVSAKDRQARLRAVLSALLALCVLVPAGFLFSRAHATVRDGRATAGIAQLGIEYLGDLGQLLTALTEAQAGAAQGRPTGQEALDLAIVTVDKTDQRLGDALGTRQRWQDLRAKMDEVRRADPDPQAVYLTYTEATRLLVALYRTVCDSSGLSRDPDRDLFHLQQAVGDHLPMVVVYATRLIDLSVLAARARPAAAEGAAGAPGGAEPGRGEATAGERGDSASAQAQAAAQAQAQAAAQPVAAAQAVDAAIDDLTDALKEAADHTASRALNSDLLGLLDRIRRAVDGIVLNTRTSDGAAAVLQSRAELQTAAADITATGLREMTVVLDGRRDELNRSDRLLLGALVATVFLVLVAAVLPLLGQRRGPRSVRHGSAPRRRETDGMPPPDPVPPAGWPPAAQRGPGIDDHRYGHPVVGAAR